MIKRSLIFLVLIIYIVSCKSKKFDRVDKVDHPIFNFKLGDFNLYVFKMCSEYSQDSDDDDNDVVSFPKYSICKENYDKKIVEEIYLFIPKSKQNDTVIYITTFSHLYTQRDYGVFNCPNFRDKIFVEDIDGLYIGKKRDNSIIFENTDVKTEWEIHTSDETIEVFKITDLQHKDGKQIDLIDVLSIPILFKSEKRKFTYGKSMYNKECLQPGIKALNSRYYNKDKFITNLLIDSEYFYFENCLPDENVNEFFRFENKKRLVYSLMK